MESKIQKLIGQMTLEEKASLCSGQDNWHFKGVERLGIPSIMVADGPHGLRKQEEEEDHLGIAKSVPATCFPTAVTTASSWDRDLLQEMGEALGDECLQENIAVLLGPGANIKRNPLCGRNFEYFSEDPYLTGEMASSFINGVQSRGVGTSLKHFAANNQEFFRMSTDTIIDERTLREIYLPGFEKAVKKSQPYTVMNAYNQVNGRFCSEHDELLNKILKEEWGHEGIVITDWGAENDRVEGLKAGQEVEMPSSNGVNDRKIVEAVKKGTLDESILDKRVSRILTLIFKADENLKNNYSCNGEEHHALAVKVASESMVLLKNEDSLLPLRKEGTLAVIGDFAKNPRYQGAGSSLIVPTRLDNALDSLRLGGKDLIDVSYAEGFSTKEDIIDKKLIEEAVNLASQSDQTVIFAGLPPSFESEGFDRKHMSLPQNQLKLIDAVLKVAPEAVIVLSNGSPVEMPFIHRAKAIVEAYLSGQGGGQAIADILLGHRVPCGKIAETFPEKLADVPSANYFPGNSKQVLYKEGLYVGYRYFDTAKKDVLFPFGHGLSYTEFDYRDLFLSSGEIQSGEQVKVSCRIINRGNIEAKEIVQLYVRSKDSSVYRPDKELKGFEKINLRPGEEKEISFTLDKRSFAHYDTNSNDWQTEGGEYSILVGASSRDIRLEEKLYIKSAFLSAESEADKIYKKAVTDIHSFSDRDFSVLLGRKIPEQPALKPFHKNSTVADISTTLPGRIFKRIILNKTRKKFGNSEESMILMIESMIQEMPLRSLAMMAGDDFSEKMLDSLLLLLNGKPVRALMKLASRG